MKKILLLSILCFSLQGFSQEIQPTENTILSKKNEFRIDVLKLLKNSRLHLSYERFLNKKFSVGLSALFLSSKVAEFSPFYYTDCDDDAKINDYQIIPYVRYSFSKNVKRYWYGELFSSINSGSYKITERLSDGTYGYYSKVEKKYNNVALGTSIGYKLYIKKRFAVDLHFGLAPNLLNTTNSPKIITRIGGNIGYRF